MSMRKVEKDEIAIGAKKTCFVITPIGELGSKCRRNVEGIISTAIDPALNACNYENSEVSHKQLTSGSITKEIFNSIYEADLVIANLSGGDDYGEKGEHPNPNVMYELALRHSARKPTIHICQIGQSLPFDIRDYRTIFYSNDMIGGKNLKNELIEMIKVIENEKNSDISNPIYDSLQKVVIGNINSKTSDIDEILTKVNERLSEIDSKLNIITIDRNIRTSTSMFSKSIGSILSEKYGQLISDLGRTPNINEFIAYCEDLGLSRNTILNFVNYNKNIFDITRSQ